MRVHFSSMKKERRMDFSNQSHLFRIDTTASNQAFYAHMLLFILCFRSWPTTTYVKERTFVVFGRHAKFSLLRQFMGNSHICILGSILRSFLMQVEFSMYVYVVYEANQTIEALIFLN